MGTIVTSTWRERQAKISVFVIMVETVRSYFFLTRPGWRACVYAKPSYLPKSQELVLASTTNTAAMSG